MKIKVKGALRDLLAFRRLVPNRQKRFAKAPSDPLGQAPVNALALQLHPGLQHLKIAEIQDETASTKTFRLVPDPDAGTQELAYFRAGQYLSLKINLGSNSITRPYSISSAPYQALGPQGFYALTIRKMAAGFFTPYLWENWEIGTQVVTSGPAGNFYHDSLRDRRKIVGLAGGTGITPLFSMAQEIVQGQMDAEMVLLYGSSDEDDIIFYPQLKDLEAQAPGKLKVVHVLSCEDVRMQDCEQGFISAELIAKYADVSDSTFFICGPQAMYEFVTQELEKLAIPQKRVRREVFGENQDISAAPDYPADVDGKVFQLRVQDGGETNEIPAPAGETVLVAMERAGLVTPSQCRSGECGLCRTLLKAGEVYVDPQGDGRRSADIKFGYIHPCASYPLSDLEVVLPEG